jgi:transcriptional regulator with XRE-family HTH domain
MILLRRLLGDVLRQRRQRQGRTLREVSADARVSLGYLSEVERGQKEASSELLAAICTALEAPLSEVLREVSDSMALAESVAPEPIRAGAMAVGPLPLIPVLERTAAARPRVIDARVIDARVIDARVIDRRVAGVAA